MTKLGDVLNTTVLARHLFDGYVRSQVHPSEPLVIYNYTEKAAWAPDGWTHEMRTCRGLIVNYETEDVVARPFAKFHNIGEPHAPDAPAGPARVMEKVDGSLGIIYREPMSGLLSVATRGAFMSDQAIHATQVLRERYDGFRPTLGYTTLVEIVFPSNRIVVDYGDMDDLVLLGVVQNFDGRTRYKADDPWPGPRAQIHPFRRPEDLPAEGVGEGFVLHWPDEDVRLKVKYAEYVRLHRIVTGVTERTVWEHLSAGLPMDELRANVPEEFIEWLDRVSMELTQTHGLVRRNAINQVDDLRRGLGKDHGRRDVALAVKDLPTAPYLFMAYDGQLDRLDAAIWKNIKPAATRPFNQVTEDVA